jgi:hypothetical protein
LREHSNQESKGRDFEKHTGDNEEEKREREKKKKWLKGAG